VAVITNHITPVSNNGYNPCSTTLAFTTTKTNQLIIVAVAAGGTSAITNMTVSGGTGLSWTKAASNISSPSGMYTSVWYAWASSVQTAQTITAAATPTTGNNITATLWALDGAKDMTGLTAGTDYVTGSGSTSGAAGYTINVTTKAAGSWLLAAGGAWSSTAVAIADNTIVYQVILGFWQQRRTDQPLAVGTWAIGDTGSAGDEWSLAVMEVLAANDPTISVIGWTF